MDVSEPGFGVSVLSDFKFGRSCHAGVLGLSLLRAPVFPDPQADQGEHEFTYSIMLHDGDWRKAGVNHQAEALRDPMFVHSVTPDQTGPIRSQWCPFSISVDGAADVTVPAIMPARNHSDLIVRLVETHGGTGRVHIDWAVSVDGVEAVDLHESPIEHAGLRHHASTGRTECEIRPFQILTLRAIRPTP